MLNQSKKHIYFAREKDVTAKDHAYNGNLPNAQNSSFLNPCFQNITHITRAQVTNRIR